MTPTDSTARTLWRRSPVATSYLDQLRRHLAVLCRDSAEVDVIVMEIESHLAEARHGGEPITTTLQLLGPPEELAEAYAVVSFDRPPGRDSGTLERLLRKASRGLQIAASFLVLTLGILLTAVSGLSGALAVVGGLVLPFVPARVLEPTLRFGLPQLVVLLGGITLLGLAVALARWLSLHSRLARRHLTVSRPVTTTDVPPTSDDSIAVFPTSTIRPPKETP